MSRIEVVEADAGMIPMVATLFDAYRQFYRQASDLEGAVRFLSERLKPEVALRRSQAS